MTKKIQTTTALVRAPTAAIDKFSDGFQNYLEDLGLPSDDVLAAVDERATVIGNVPKLVQSLTDEQRTDAMYMSKFIAACGAGLFDAALNFLWDEVVVRLRSRVAHFDLGYFLDTALPDPQTRKQFKTEDDLRSLSDDALIRGALKCGIISDIAYKHLDYIRDMRNWASAAHPNHVQLTGLQLAAWCETCVKEVLIKEPDGAVLEVGRLLENLRTQKLTANEVPAISTSLRRLRSDLVTALLRSIVGLYCDPRQEVRVRDNARLVARDVWDLATTSARAEVGLKYANYAANADVDRKKLAHEFLDLVDGLSFLPESDRAVEIATLVTRLESAHDGMNNFYNEPPIARELRKFIGVDGAVPPLVNDEYVRVLARCRIGRTSGVSNMASPLYDALFDLFSEPQIRAFVGVLERPEITTRLDNHGCAERFREIAAKLKGKVVDQPLRRVYELMLGAGDQQLPKLSLTTEFQRVVKASQPR
jgi:hypothetical protein